MKKTIYIAIIMLTIICNLSYVKAATTATVKLSANKDNLEKGEEVEITFSINEQQTASFLVNIYFDNTKFDYVSGPEGIVVEEDKIKILWYDTRTEEMEQNKENLIK